MSLASGTLATVPLAAASAWSTSGPSAQLSAAIITVAPFATATLTVRA